MTPHTTTKPSPLPLPPPAPTPPETERFTAHHRRKLISDCVPGNVFVLVNLFSSAISPTVHAKENDSKALDVSYDSRSLLINGKRAQAEDWEDLIKKAKQRRLELYPDGIEISGLSSRRLARLACGRPSGSDPLSRPNGIMDHRVKLSMMQQHMAQWVSKVVNMMEENKLYASQGGPIILSQIENEYDHVKAAFKAAGNRYIKWAGDFALSLDIGVPWIMCKQKNAPGEVTLSKVQMHPPNQIYGPRTGLLNIEPLEIHLRQDQWKIWHIQWPIDSQKNGSHVNYYMYYGGTNYGRTAATFVTTRYYDDAPLDEFGLVREPKWGHLRDLHYTLALLRKALLWGSNRLHAMIYGKLGDGICTAFLKNNDSHIVSQHSARFFTRSEVANKNLKWQMTTKTVPTEGRNFHRKLVEHIELNILDMPMRKWLHPVLEVLALGHSMLELNMGSKDHTFNSFTLSIQLNEGTNTLSFLGTTVGMPDGGAYQKHRFTGLRNVLVKGLATGDLDLSFNGFHHKYAEEGAKKAKWGPSNKGAGPALAWYKTYFDAPEGNDPVAIYMEKITKGMVWVNGLSIGRCWSSFLTEYDKPSQSEYHIPRSFLKPKNNFLVIFDEAGGSIDTVEIRLANRGTICSFVGENYPPYVKSWKHDNKEIMEVVEDPKAKARLECPNRKVITAVEHAGFGAPWGTCGLCKNDNCTMVVNKVIEELCLGEKSCKVPLDKRLLMKDVKVDPCPSLAPKHLAIQAKCSLFSFSACVEGLTVVVGAGDSLESATPFSLGIED
ncbi:Beta-galactosidase 13-like protein [Drosera capensis]